jgi:hypothetical protein
MKFRDLAANETSTLIGRLATKRAKTSLDELQALRKSLTQAMSTVEGALESWGDLGHADEVKALAEQLAKAAADETTAATERANAEAQKAVDSIRKELEQYVAEKQKLSSAVDELRAQVQSLESTSKAAEAARDKDAKARATAEGELAHVQAALVDARSQIENAAKALSSLERAKLESDDARREMQARLDFAVASEATLTDRVNELEREAKKGGGKGRGPEQTYAGLDRLAEVFDKLALVTSVPEMLNALADGLAADFSRVALFSVKGNRLEGVHQVGFDSTSDISKVAVPLNMDSLLTRALASNRVEAFAAADLPDTTRAPFGGSPAHMMALPIKVHDEVLGVIYADDSGRPQPDTDTLNKCATFAELLHRHAVPMLEKLMAEQKMLNELRAYTVLLLDEVEYMYNADTSQGMKDADLKARLKENLQCARQIYAQRVAAEGPVAARLLEEHIASVIDARGGTPFARDLGAVAGIQPSASGKKASRQAS